MFIQRLKYPSWRSSHSIKSTLLTGKALYNGPREPLCPIPTTPLYTLLLLGHLNSCHFLLCQVLPGPQAFCSSLLWTPLYLLTTHHP